MDWTALATGALGALAVILPAIWALRKIKPEMRNLDADTAKTWQEIADQATEQVQRLTQRVEKMERLMNNQKYEVRLVFTGGEVPRVHEANVRHVVISEVA